LCSTIQRAEIRKNWVKGWENLSKNCHYKDEAGGENPMRYLYYFLFAGMVLLNVYSCTTSKIETSHIKPIRFGVVNKFPDHPNWLKEKTLTVNQKSAVIDSLFVKDQLTLAVEKSLVSKGYEVVAVESKDALKEGLADMVIEIVPREVFKKEGTLGYGFADRKFLLGLIKNKPHSYVAMELTLSRKNSGRVIKTGREERFSEIGMDTMPDGWDQLSLEDKKMFEENLQENMVKTADLLLSRLKI
jgi:hypothetical protein